MLKEHLIKIAGVIVCFFLSACVGQYPQFRDKVHYNYAAAVLAGSATMKTKESITIEDNGTASKVIQPVKVHACRGNQLLYKNVRKTRYVGGQAVKYNDTEPVLELVDPLANVYLRRVRIHNATEHILFLSQIDAVLVDPAGNDHEMVSKDILEQFLLSQRTCSSTREVVASLQSLKLLGGQARLRPKREQEFFLAFPNLKLVTPGEWRMEFHNFPTRTDEAGNVTRKTSFEFPLEVKQYKVTVKQRKDNFLSPWKEISRTQEQVEN